ncbi:RNA-binding protein, partial [Patescibacteria group bacterium]|nr:RNA-binding protein [Patescibacteria group bacterium]
VTMATDDEAQAAVDKLDGTEVMGRNIKVSIARPPKPRDENY